MHVKENKEIITLRTGIYRKGLTFKYNPVILKKDNLTSFICYPRKCSFIFKNATIKRKIRRILVRGILMYE